MGPKQKIAKNGWEECIVCSLILQSVDVESHMKLFHDNADLKSDDVQSPRYSTAKNRNSVGYHGFIKLGIIHGFGKEVDSNCVPSQLSSYHKDDIVLLSISAMALTNIGIGDTVLVWSNNKKFLFQTAWPSKDSNQLSIGLSNRSLLFLVHNTNDILHAQKVSSVDIRPAVELLLEGKDVKPFYDHPDFSSFVLRSVCNKIVSLGSTVLVSYYGQQCEFSVAKIDGQEREKSVINDISMTELDVNLMTDMSCQKIANIRLNDSNSSLDDKIDMSTRSSLNASYTELVPSSSTPKSECKKPCSCEQSKPMLTERIHYISLKTKLSIRSSESVMSTEEIRRIKKITFDDIGGLDRQIKDIQQLLFFPENGSKMFSSYGIQPPKGILLFGPSGTGKTLIANAIANSGKFSFIEINGPELYSKFYGETEKRIQEMFRNAKKRAPSIVFIDEIDTLCPRRDGVLSQLEQRVVTTLLLEMDSLQTNIEDRVIVLAATNKPDSLDSALRRPGRFDREIEIGIPTASDREDILRKLLNKVIHKLTDNEIKCIASDAHGFVGADLAALCAQAGLNYLQTAQFNDSQTENESSGSNGVTYGNIIFAAKYVKPSGLREVLIEVPKVYWTDIGGQEHVKHKLKQMVDWPLTHPEAFERLGITPPKGILMFGPPGCSKTLIAKALATESRLNFIAVKGPELFRKWVGESERAIREVFRKARAAAPSIIFIDEIDSLAAERGSSSGGSNVGDRVLAQLLLEMDGLEKLHGVVIIASTNRPDMIDKALLRPGRLDHILYIPLPDDNTRREIFKIQSKRVPFAVDVDIDYLVKNTNGYSGAEVVAVCTEAALHSLEDSLNATSVTACHFEYALQVVRPRISQDLILFYEKYTLQSSKIKS